MILGIDIGTTNIKILAMQPGDASRVWAEVSAPLVTLSPKPGYAEQEPEMVWQTVNILITNILIEIAEVDRSTLTVCFSAGMHSLLAVDGRGKPITNALLWADNRAEAQADALRTTSARLGRDLYRRTGVPIHPMLPLCKLAWFGRHRPALLRRAARWISLKEYVWHKLTGRYQIDLSMATATGLFDQKNRCWYKPALAYAGVKPSQLSDLVATTFSETYQLDDGLLPVGTRLVIGASDGCLANLGAGAIGPGITTITIGTSGAVRRTVNQPRRDPDGRLFCYWLAEMQNLDNQGINPCYIVGGPTNNGGNVLDWLRHQFAPGESTPGLSVDEIMAEAATVPPRADGLTFRPYLHGERAPLWDAHVRGSFAGIDARHRRAHFLRAALEGVMLNLMQIEHRLARLCGPTTMIYANGGFAASEFWVQLLADIAGVPVRLNASNESAAIGAILLAQFSDSRNFSSLDKLAETVPFGRTFWPDPVAHGVYVKGLHRSIPPRRD